tara:strand:+ start:6963 stop:7301 length:339 start_codon:yes stop_codon:yes gene_type:complete
MGRYGVNIAPVAGIKRIQRGQYNGTAGNSTAQINDDTTIHTVDEKTTYMAVCESGSFPVTNEGGGVTDNRTYPHPQAAAYLLDENTVRVRYRISSYGQSEQQWIGWQVVELM